MLLAERRSRPEAHLHPRKDAEPVEIPLHREEAIGARRRARRRPDEPLDDPHRGPPLAADRHPPHPRLRPFEHRQLDPGALAGLVPADLGGDVDLREALRRVLAAEDLRRAVDMDPVVRPAGGERQEPQEPVAVEPLDAAQLDALDEPPRTFDDRHREREARAVFGDRRGPHPRLPVTEQRVGRTEVREVVLSTSSSEAATARRERPPGRGHPPGEGPRLARRRCR